MLVVASSRARTLKRQLREGGRLLRWVEKDRLFIEIVKHAQHVLFGVSCIAPTGALMRSNVYLQNYEQLFCEIEYLNFEGDGCHSWRLRVEGQSARTACYTD